MPNPYLEKLNAIPDGAADGPVATLAPKNPYLSRLDSVPDGAADNPYMAKLADVPDDFASRHPTLSGIAGAAGAILKAPLNLADTVYNAVTGGGQPQSPMPQLPGYPTTQPKPEGWGQWAPQTPYEAAPAPDSVLPTNPVSAGVEGSLAGHVAQSALGRPDQPLMDRSNHKPGFVGKMIEGGTSMALDTPAFLAGGPAESMVAKIATGGVTFGGLDAAKAGLEGKSTGEIAGAGAKGAVVGGAMGAAGALPFEMIGKAGIPAKLATEAASMTFAAAAAEGRAPTKEEFALNLGMMMAMHGAGMVGEKRAGKPSESEPQPEAANGEQSTAAVQRPPAEVVPGVNAEIPIPPDKAIVPNANETSGMTPDLKAEPITSTIVPDQTIRNSQTVQPAGPNPTIRQDRTVEPRTPNANEISGRPPDLQAEQRTPVVAENATTPLADPSGSQPEVTGKPNEPSAKDLQAPETTDVAQPVLPELSGKGENAPADQGEATPAQARPESKLGEQLPENRGAATGIARPESVNPDSWSKLSLKSQAEVSSAAKNLDPKSLDQYVLKRLVRDQGVSGQGGGSETAGNEAVGPAVSDSPVEPPAKEPPIKPPSTEKAEEPHDPSKTTGLKTSLTQVEREAIGLGRVDSPQKMSDIETLHEAKAEGLVEKADAIATDVLNKNRPMTNKETAAVAVRRQEIKKRLREISKQQVEGDPNSPDAIFAEHERQQLEGEIERLTRANIEAGTAWGRSGQIRSRELDESMDKFVAIARAERAKGEPLTSQERAKLEKMIEEHERVNADLQKRMEELEHQDAGEEVMGVRKLRKQNREEIEKEYNDSLESVRKLLRAGCELN